MKKIIAIATITLLTSIQGCAETSDAKAPLVVDVSDGTATAVAASTTGTKPDDSENKDKPFKMPNIILINNGAL